MALTADVSKMYRAIELTDDDKDLHRFVWRSQPDDPLKDYRMTRLTFGVSASSFAVNMAVKQNAIDCLTTLSTAPLIVLSWWICIAKVELQRPLCSGQDP